MNSNNEYQNTKDPISSLPEPSALNIFSFLKPNVVAQLGQVSKSFLKLSRNKTLWGSFFNQLETQENPTLNAQKHVLPKTDNPGHEYCEYQKFLNWQKEPTEFLKGKDNSNPARYIITYRQKNKVSPLKILQITVTKTYCEITCIFSSPKELNEYRKLIKHIDPFPQFGSHIKGNIDQNFWCSCYQVGVLAIIKENYFSYLGNFCNVLYQDIQDSIDVNRTSSQKENTNNPDENNQNSLRK